MSSLRSPGAGGRGPLSVAFNQDASCVCASDMAGIRIWNLDTCKHALKLNLGAISIVQMLYRTSLLAYVGAGEQASLTPRRLTLLNTHTNAVIQTLSYGTRVLQVALNRRRLAAVCERSCYVYTLEDLSLLGTLETPPNPDGVAALCDTGGRWGGAQGEDGDVSPPSSPRTPAAEPPLLLALPSGECGGSICVYDVGRAGAAVAIRAEIPAHRSRVAALAWSECGKLLASTSVRGTLVKVHRVGGPDAGGPGWAFRRGATPATVRGLCFSRPARPGGHPGLLAAASNHGTVHLFRLIEGAGVGGGVRRVSPVSVGAASEAAAAAGRALQAVVPQSWAVAVSPERAAAAVRVPGRPAAAVCAFRGRESGERGSLLVLTAEGVLYSFELEGMVLGPLRWSLTGEWQV